MVNLSDWGFADLVLAPYANVNMAIMIVELIVMVKTG